MYQLRSIPHILLANQNCSSTISTGLLVLKKKIYFSPHERHDSESSKELMVFFFEQIMTSALGRSAVCLSKTNVSKQCHIWRWRRVIEREERVWKRKKKNRGRERKQRRNVAEESGNEKKGKQPAVLDKCQCLGMCKALVYGRFPHTDLSERLNPQPCA